MDIGKTIKALRKKEELSQTALADLCGISATYLSQLENNRKSPSSELTSLLAANLNVPVPIFYFLAMEESDIPREKQVAYQILAPTINGAIAQLFLDKADKD
jgi:XRE family transcriptional regulator, regulator of sulfur utilization